MQFSPFLCFVGTGMICKHFFLMIISCYLKILTGISHLSQENQVCYSCIVTEIQDPEKTPNELINSELENS